MSLPPLTRIPPHVASVEDYEALAGERLDPAIFAYLIGGAADEETLEANRSVYGKHRIWPRILRDVSCGNTGLDVFGVRHAHPFFLAPTAYHRMFHPEGEMATMLGASAMDACFVIGTKSTTAVETLVPQAAVPPWFQVYFLPEKEDTLALVNRAEAAGCAALMVTGDAPLSGIRNRQQRSGFRIPEGITLPNLEGLRLPEPADRVFGSDLLANAPGWEDLAWLKQNTCLPVVLKGVLHPADARLAVDHGVDGIVVSNHGGRTLDGVPAALEVLPGVVNEVGGAIPVWVDGGIRRGTDAFKALALGATAVMIGRPYLHGLAAAGAVGVAHVLRILRAELEVAMALSGCATLEDIDAKALF